MLTDLIARYMNAKHIWEAQFDEDCDRAANSPEWRVYMDASSTLIYYRCASMQEISQRAEFMLSEENLIDILAGCSTDAAVRGFLTSMAAPVENGGN